MNPIEVTTDPTICDGALDTDEQYTSARTRAAMSGSIDVIITPTEGWWSADGVTWSRDVDLGGDCEGPGVAMVPRPFSPERIAEMKRRSAAIMARHRAERDGEWPEGWPPQGAPGAYYSKWSGDRWITLPNTERGRCAAWELEEL